MTNNNQFHVLLRKYLVEYLPAQRHNSPATIRTYKQSLNSYRIYMETVLNTLFENLDFKHFDKDGIYAYIVWLRDIKHCSPKTLNVRLSAIKSFLHYCGNEDIELMTYYVKCSDICQFRDTSKKQVDYLTQKQLKSLFEIPDIHTRLGRRNRFFMIFTYETGVRMQEILNMKLSDLIVTDDGAIRIRILGKGRKVRYVPLLNPVIKHLKAYLKEFHPLNNPNEYLFYTIHDLKHTQMKAGTVNAFLSKYAVVANRQDSTFPLNLHEHMLRHSVAMAMYKSGIPISYIRDFLGHNGIETTKIYAYSDQETIAKALESVSNVARETAKPMVKEWKGKKSLLEYCGLV